MATKKSNAGSSVKMTFGKRKKGKARKCDNKHKSKKLKYRGQGR